MRRNYRELNLRQALWDNFNSDSEEDRYTYDDEDHPPYYFKGFHNPEFDGTHDLDHRPPGSCVIIMEKADTECAAGCPGDLVPIGEWDH